MKTKSFILVLSSVFLASCGNPHLKEFDLDRLVLPSTVAPQLTRDLKDPIIRVDENDSVVRITTKKPLDQKDVEIVSIDEGKDLIVSYELELGKEFSIASSDCAESLSTLKACSIKVNFATTEPGVYKDNLIISYKEKDTLKDVKQVKVSLVGERLLDTEPVELKALVLRNVDGDEFVKIKPESDDSSDLQEELVSKNSNQDRSLFVKYSLESGTHFELSLNDCEEELKASTSCNPIVKLKASEPGSYKDYIIATYSSDKNGKDAKEVKIPVTAEILAKEITPIKSLEVKAKDGSEDINLQTLEDELSVEVLGFNPNDTSLKIISILLEKNENFRVESTDCKNEIVKKSSCGIEITFNSDKEGKYTDNLVVVYTTQGSDEKHQVVVPLSVEKLRKIPTDLKVEIESNLGANGVDFGKSFISKKPSKFVKVKNKSSSPVKFLGAGLANENQFKLGKNGTCKINEEINDECTVEVIFNASSKGLKEEELSVQFASIYGGKELTTSAKLIGEKIEDEAEVKPAKIEFSWKSTEDVDFKTVAVGSLHKATVELLNTGDVEIELASIKLSGKTFTLNHDCKKILLAGSCSLDISYLPLEEGVQNGELIVVAKNGQEIKLKVKGTAQKEKACVKRHINVISTELSYDLKKVILPYENSKKGTTATLTNLYGTKVNNYIKSLNHYTVKDAQVITTFKLPALKGKIVALDMDLNVSKVVQDGYKDTEMFCLSTDSIQKCSGNDFKTSNFYSLKNEKFWKNNSAPVNSQYEEELMDNISKCGSYDCSSFKGKISVIKTLELSEKELASMKADGVVSVIITDDTKHISNPSLTVVTEEQVNCAN